MEDYIGRSGLLGYVGWMRGGGGERELWRWMEGGGLPTPGSASFASTFRHLPRRSGPSAGDGFLIAEKRELGGIPAGRASSWGPRLLSDRFYREATEAPVPLDLRVLRALRSPFEIDIYVWLTWRFFRLRRPVTIPWASLALQFGSRYTNPRHFKKRFLGYLKCVIDYYPEVRLESTAVGLMLKPSPTHIEQRPGKRQNLQLGGAPPA